MGTKKLIALVGIGLAIGLAIGFPLARLSQPVKTAVVTKTVKVQTMVENGIALTALLKGFGSSLGVSQQPLSSNNYVQCIVYRGPSPDVNTHALKTGDWVVYVCAKVK